MNTQKAIIILLLTATLGFLAACGPGSENGAVQSNDALEATGPVPVLIEPLTSRAVARPIMASGLLAPAEELTLSFKVPGIIAQTLVKEGGKVKKGQLLARLDPVEIDAQVRQARQAFEKAERDLSRAEALLEDSVVTLETVQDLRTAREVAEANLHVAEFNRKYTEVRAPVDGVIMSRMAERGELIEPGKPVYILGAAHSPSKLRVGLPDVDVIRLQDGDPAEVRFDAWPGEVFAATVAEIGAAADPLTGTYAVSLIIENPQRPINAGFFGTATIRPSLAEKDVLIPLSAVVSADESHARIFVPAGSLAQARQVELPYRYIKGDSLAVPQTALEGIETVITKGSRYLKDGQAYRMIDTPNIANK